MMPPVIVDPGAAPVAWFVILLSVAWSIAGTADVWARARRRQNCDKGRLSAKRPSESDTREPV